MRVSFIWGSIAVGGVTLSDSSHKVMKRPEAFEMWRCPYCAKMSPRHWNMERHIQSQHGSWGKPMDSITGLIRGRPYQKPSQTVYYFNPRPTQFFGDNRIEDDSAKAFWEAADKVNNLKELQLIQEIKGNLSFIIQQNTQIISLLGKILDTRHF